VGACGAINYKDAFDAFTELVNDTDFDALLAKAAADPHGEEAQQVHATTTPGPVGPSRSRLPLPLRLASRARPRALSLALGGRLPKPTLAVFRVRRCSSASAPCSASRSFHAIHRP